MKKIIILVVIVLCIVVAVIVVLYRKHTTNQLTVPPAPVTFPVTTSGNSSGVNTQPIQIPTNSDQGSVTVSDFIHNGVTAEDTMNPGTYYLAGDVGYCNTDGSCPSGAPSSEFHILYSDADKAFIIALLEEPIGTSRRDAETFLMNALNISQQEMCSLRYRISTTGDVNQQYGGVNLGFSFCPGAVQLP